MKKIMKLSAMIAVLTISMAAMAEAQSVDPRVAGILDPVYYVNKYPDLKAAFGNNAAAAEEHWLKYGIAECRESSSTFHIRWYLKNNPDLVKAFGGDCVKALNHWLAFGKKEGRRTASADVRIRFLNQTNVPIDVYMLKGQKESLVQKLVPAGSLTMSAYTKDLWRMRLNGNIVGTYFVTKEATQTVEMKLSNFDAGPIWNGADAKKKCSGLAANVPGAWTTGWRTTVEGKMSVCEIAFLEAF